MIPEMTISTQKIGSLSLSKQADYMDTTKVFDYRAFDPWKRLREIGMFFQSRDLLHHAMRRLIRRLEKAGVPYALMGAMAVNMHGARRTTDDVDILLTGAGLECFREELLPKFYK